MRQDWVNRIARALARGRDRCLTWQRAVQPPWHTGYAFVETQGEASLEKAGTWFREALAAGAATAFVWDTRTRLTHRCINAGEILGFEPRRPITATDFIAHIHPQDRTRFKAQLNNVRPESPAYAISFRFVRPDGKQVWLEETAKAEFDEGGQVRRLRGLTRDVSSRKRAEEHRDLLIAEADHRVKNVLARVSAAVQAARQSSHSMEEFILALDGRLEALTQAHALLGRCRRVGFAKLVSRQLAPYADARNTTLAGPNVALPAAATEALAMALHELVTNAAKYGALSVPGGHVCVKWGHCMGGDQLEVFRVQWRESGGPLVKQPTRAGFGIQLIRELIPYECGGTVELVFAAGGLSCTLDIPSAKQEAARLSDLRPSNPWTPFNRAGPQRLKVD